MARARSAATTARAAGRSITTLAADGDGGAGSAAAVWRYRRGWLFGETVTWPAERAADYAELRAHLVFRDELRAAAAEFAARRLHGEPYIAVHWRRGDRTHPEMGAGGRASYDAVAPPRLVRFVRRLLRRHPAARRVLLLTNSGEAAERAATARRATAARRV